MSKPVVCGDVLLVPLGLEGHLAPFMSLARRFLERGISCTLLWEESKTGLLERNFNMYGSLQSTAGFNVKLMPTFTSIGKSFPDFVAEWGASWESDIQELLQGRRDGGKGPGYMIVDQFAAWTNRWAKELAISRYVFFLSPATFAYFVYRYSALIEKDKLLERVDEDPIMDLPGAPDIRLSETPEPAIPRPELYTSNGETFDDAAGILFNTFYELEASVIDSLDSQLNAASGGIQKGRKQSKALPIGPLAPPKTIGDTAFGVSEEDSKCIRWLDTRSLGSVVYIAFGTRSPLPRAQILELANALETTKVNFLWIVLAPSDVVVGSWEMSDVSKVLPPGFLERTKNYGFVHAVLAPQLQILEHPATGAFLTHCGWNSAIEGTCRGVPLIGWPRGSDQSINCRALERAGVAARIRPEITGPDDLLESAVLERAIRTWMVEGPGRRKLRERVLELQHLAREAANPGGSSFQNLEDLIQKFLRKEPR